MYEIFLKASAEKELEHFSSKIHDRIVTKLLSLQENPRQRGAKKLQGRDNCYKVRVGNYRILYTIDDKKQEVMIVAIGHRREVYR
jgi:mRNA interferase RelE/StbE